MKLINFLIRERNNCSLGGNFRVWHHAEICQFDRLSLEINFKKEHAVVVTEFPDWFKFNKMKILCSVCHYASQHSSGRKVMILPFPWDSRISNSFGDIY